MDHRFPSGDLQLAGHVAIPRRPEPDLPGLILCHGYPSGSAGGAGAGATYPELADRIAAHVGWAVLTFCFRGCDGSEGNFSLRGWLEDIDAAIDHLRDTAPITGVWLAGFGTGGSLCVCAGAATSAVRGVAMLGGPADFDDWASHPRRLLEHARDLGMVRDRSFPASFEAWAREIREIRPIAAVSQLAPRPLLIIHGSEDDAVPHFDARVLSDAHGSGDLRVIGGAGHALRHDPRAIAVLLGWLDRQRNQVA